VKKQGENILKNSALSVTASRKRILTSFLPPTMHWPIKTLKQNVPTNMTVLRFTERFRHFLKEGSSTTSLLQTTWSGMRCATKPASPQGIITITMCISGAINVVKQFAWTM